MDTAEQIAKILLDKKAVTLSTNPPYTWTSGIKAPIYCDNRLLISYPEERRQVLEGFKKIIKENNLEFDVIGGTATAAIPWAAFLAQELNIPMVYIRPEPKGHGAGKQVEGTMENGSKILIVEDLISSGGSSLRSAEACVREYNTKIVGVVAIFTYEMKKAKDGFAEVDYPLHTLSNFSTLVNLASNTGYIGQDEKETVLSWSSDPDNWTV